MRLRTLALLLAILLGAAAPVALLMGEAAATSAKQQDVAAHAGLAGVLLEVWGCGAEPHVAHHAIAAAHEWEQGQHEEALASLRSCAACLREELGPDDAHGRQDIRAAQAQVLAVGAEAAVAESRVGDVVYFLEAARGSELHTRLSVGVHLLSDAALDELAEDESAARRAEAEAFAAWQAASSAGRLKAVQAARRVLNAASERRAEIRRQTERLRWHVSSSARPRAASVRDLQRRLAADEALVQYALLPTGAFALVLTHDEKRIARLGTCEEVLDAVAALDIHDTTRDPTPAIQALRALLVEKLTLGEEAKRLVVVPDGELAQLPYALLFTTRAFALVPSGGVWLAMRELRERRGTGVLALGNPDYGRSDDGTPLPVDASGHPPLALEASGDEVRCVGDDVFVGTEASETTLRQVLAVTHPWSAVHLACHGLLANRREGCALALAATAKDDGILGVPEIEDMTLETDLVVLSACHSGEGPVVPPEGCVGLARAFLAAGAPRVVASLGSVDDEATAALMECFHEHWAAGASAPDALSRAQAHVRAQPKWSHPHWWACWTVWGLGE